MIADAGAPVVLAPVPLAVILADARAPTVLASALDADMLQMLTPTQLLFFQKRWVMLALRGPLCLPLSTPPPASLLRRIVGLLPCQVAVSPLLAALAAHLPRCRKWGLIIVRKDALLRNITTFEHCFSGRWRADRSTYLGWAGKRRRRRKSCAS
jgi:hypothetical protein